MSLSTTDINALVKETLELTGPRTEQYQVAAETKLAENLPLPLADSVQIQQVLLNLFGNAVDAMALLAQGERTLTVATSVFEDRAVQVTVADTGPGLDPEAAQRLFEPFYTTKPSGLGMGLAISRSIVEVHGGRIWAEPNTPQGTRVCFTLPFPHADRASRPNRPNDDG